MKHVNLKLSAMVHAKLKLWCFENGYTLRDGLTLVVEQFVKSKRAPMAAVLAESVNVPVFEPVQRPAPGWSPPAPGPTPGGRPADPLGRDLIP